MLWCDASVNLIYNIYIDLCPTYTDDVDDELQEIMKEDEQKLSLQIASLEKQVFMLIICRRCCSLCLLCC